MTCIQLYGNESFKNEVNLLILNATTDFVLCTNIFHKPFYLLWIQGCFSFYSYYVATILQSFKILFFTFSYYFFISLATMIGMVPGDCYFYVCCVNFYFLRKKKFIVVLWMHLWPKQICYFLTYFRKIKHLEKMYFFQKQTNKQTNERANKQTNLFLILN